jgi:hypothetical protein
MDTLFSYPFGVLLIAGLLFGLLGIAYLIAAFIALKQLRLMKAGYRLILSLLFLPLAMISSGILLGIQGYQSLTYEHPIAEVEVKPIAKQTFETTVRFANHQTRVFLLHGDQVQIDAHIIKWKPVANVLGLHTHYQLNRISGRYKEIDDARRKPTSAYDLSEKNGLNLIDIRQSYPYLSSWLFDAEYGSATFISADQPQQYRLLVSTSGLLFREKNALN